MGRPQFSKPVERPVDQAVRNDDIVELQSNPTVGSGLTETLSYFTSFDDPQILESISVRADPTTAPINEWVAFEVRVLDDDLSESVLHRAFGIYPNSPLIQFDPGINVPAGGHVEIDVRQASGSNIDIQVALGHREVTQ